MIRIHREGRLIVAITVVILTILLVCSALFLPYLVNDAAALVSLVVLILVFRFFRVPRRRPFLDEKTITAPADGRVVAIEKVEEKEFLKSTSIQVSIFMSIHDVHINYFPVSGKVSYLRYHPGRYLVARYPKSSRYNEHCSIGIDTPSGPVLVRQIAGFVARRIKCYAAENCASRQGEEMGFIKFGSRLDLFLPVDSSIQIELDQQVTGSVTPIARFK
jgi:phosphatidylserine decarboxylase